MKRPSSFQRHWNRDCRVSHPELTLENEEEVQASAARAPPTLLPWRAENNCKAVWIAAEVALPKLCLWSRLEVISFLVGFSLELGSGTFSSYPQWLLYHTLCPFSLWQYFFPVFSHQWSAFAPNLSFIVLGFSLAYISLNINGPKMTLRKKCTVNYLASWLLSYLPTSLLLPPN